MVFITYIMWFCSIVSFAPLCLKNIYIKMRREKAEEDKVVSLWCASPKNSWVALSPELKVSPKGQKDGTKMGFFLIIYTHCHCLCFIPPFQHAFWVFHTCPLSLPIPIFHPSTTFFFSNIHLFVKLKNK